MKNSSKVLVATIAVCSVLLFLLPFDGAASSAPISACKPLFKYEHAATRCVKYDYTLKAPKCRETSASANPCFFQKVECGDDLHGDPITETTVLNPSTNVSEKKCEEIDFAEGSSPATMDCGGLTYNRTTTRCVGPDIETPDRSPRFTCNQASRYKKLKGERCYVVNLTDLETTCHQGTPSGTGSCVNETEVVWQMVCPSDFPEDAEGRCAKEVATDTPSCSYGTWDSTGMCEPNLSATTPTPTSGPADEDLSEDEDSEKGEDDTTDEIVSDEVPSADPNSPCPPGYRYFPTTDACQQVDVTDKNNTCQKTPTTPPFSPSICYTERMRCRKKSHGLVSPTVCEKNKPGAAPYPADRQCEHRWELTPAKDKCIGKADVGQPVYTCNDPVYNVLRGTKCRYEVDVLRTWLPGVDRCDYGVTKLNPAETKCESRVTMDATATCARGTPVNGECVETERPFRLYCADKSARLEGEKCQLRVRYKAKKICYKGTPGGNKDCATKVKVEGRMECPCVNHKKVSGIIACEPDYTEAAAGKCEKKIGPIVEPYETNSDKELIFDEEDISGAGAATAARGQACKPGWRYLSTPPKCVKMHVKGKDKTCPTTSASSSAKCYSESMRCKKDRHKQVYRRELVPPTVCEMNAPGAAPTPAVRDCGDGYYYNEDDKICHGMSVVGVPTYSCQDGTYTKLGGDNKCRKQRPLDDTLSWVAGCDICKCKGWFQLNSDKTACESKDTRDSTPGCVKGTPVGKDCVEFAKPPTLKCDNKNEKLEGESCQLKVRYKPEKVCYEGDPGDCSIRVEVEGRMACDPNYTETPAGKCEKQVDIDSVSCPGKTITRDGICVD